MVNYSRAPMGIMSVECKQHRKEKSYYNNDDGNYSITIMKTIMTLSMTCATWPSPLIYCSVLGQAHSYKLNKIFFLTST